MWARTHDKQTCIHLNVFFTFRWGFHYTHVRRQSFHYVSDWIEVKFESGFFVRHSRLLISFIPFALAQLPGWLVGLARCVWPSRKCLQSTTIKQTVDWKTTAIQWLFMIRVLTERNEVNLDKLHKEWCFNEHLHVARLHQSSDSA